MVEPEVLLVMTLSPVLVTQVWPAQLASSQVPVVCAVPALGALAAAAVVLRELEAFVAGETPALSPRLACLVEVGR